MKKTRIIHPRFFYYWDTHDHALRLQFSQVFSTAQYHLLIFLHGN